MKQLKSTLHTFAFLSLLGGALAVPVAALAEDPVAPGTTVKTIPLTSTQYKVTDASGQVIANQPLSAIVSSIPAPAAAPIDTAPPVAAPSDNAPAPAADINPGASPVSPADAPVPAN